MQAESPNTPKLQCTLLLLLLLQPALCLLHQFIVVSTLIFEEKLLGDKVSGERDGGDAEAREGALEAVEAGEGACVPPLLAVGRVSIWAMVYECRLQHTIVPMGHPLCRWRRLQQTSWGQSR
jgi:hypothetical protein